MTDGPHQRNIPPSALQVLNLFLALLLSSFGASNLSGANNDEDGTNKLTEAFNRIGRFKRFIKNLIVRGLNFLKDKILDCFRRSLTLERGESRHNLCKILYVRITIFFKEYSSFIDTILFIELISWSIIFCT